MTNAPKTEASKAPEPSESVIGAYRVLARKYRPQDFTGLVGQEALVRTLTNAIHRGRLAHAFLLTGVRGVGKTTTARIIARALNCIGADGTLDGPTAEPCGVCENCKAIGEDRHMDVLEMDAASRTGVDDIRELIEGVRYRPTSARYKVYIIDEVHMLSRNAFNALLKTLEEPPEHVKFIFCTTETGKIPVTVLSRCQRFDLRRVEVDTLMAHLGSITQQESVDLSSEALTLLARAADGSVRDGLSLLDQAIALADQDDGAIDDKQVRTMLGLADRSVTFDILDAIMKGDIGQALETVATQYEAGADPVFVIEDLLELTHWLTRLRVVPTAIDAPGLSEAERTRGPDMSKGLSMAVLTRAWQMLLKGLNEVRTAPRPVQALEMVLIRLAYAAELPSPAEALETLKKNSSNAPSSSGPQASGNPASGNQASGAPMTVSQPAAPATPATATTPMASSRPSSSGGAAHAQQLEVVAQSTAPETVAATQPVSTGAPETTITSFDTLVALATERREGTLLAHLENSLHLVRFEAGRIEFRPTEGAPSDLASRLIQFLKTETGARWVVTVSQEEGAPTIQQTRNEKKQQKLTDVAMHPLVQAVMTNFPGATIENVQTREITNAEDGAEDNTEDN
jgi:DNA polymerase-3 subunit gamma/tau